MADFFTRLARRTLGVVPTIQPVMAAMYAPEPALTGQQAGMPLLEEEELASSGQEEQRLPGLAEAHASTKAGNEQEILTSAEEARVNSFSPQVQERVPAIPAFSQQNVFSTARNRARTRQPVPGTGRDEAGAIAPGTPSPGVAVTGDSQEMPPRTAAFLPAGVDTELPQAPATVQSQGMSSDLPVPVPASEGQFTSQATKLSARHGRSGSPVSARRTESEILPLEQREEVSERAAQPGIQVTIGRIEVRAIPPASSPLRPQRSPSTPSIMGLEDYLNRRAKGGP